MKLKIQFIQFKPYQIGQALRDIPGTLEDKERHIITFHHNKKPILFS